MRKLSKKHVRSRKARVNTALSRSLSLALSLPPSLLFSSFFPVMSFCLFPSPADGPLVPFGVFAKKMNPLISFPSVSLSSLIPLSLFVLSFPSLPIYFHPFHLAPQSVSSSVSSPLSSPLNTPIFITPLSAVPLSSLSPGRIDWSMGRCHLRAARHRGPAGAEFKPGQSGRSLS